MKRLYWRPKHVSHKALLVIAILAAAALVTVETFRKPEKQPWQEEKLEAAQLAQEAFDRVRLHRLELSSDYEIDPVMDPANSGLIGFASTPVTSTRGGYVSKRTSINPNFAAVIVHYLKEAGVERGEQVAVAVSGSFPAINICAYAAMATLGVRPIIIASASSSEWGANDPDFLWLDMERLLHEEDVFPFRASAATLGGLEDCATGLPEATVRLLRSGIERNGVEFLDPRSLRQSAAMRRRHYQKHRSRPIALYLNVGGGQGSTGGFQAKKAFRPGLNLATPQGIDPRTSVMASFSRRGIPVLHLINIKELAREFQLPLSPETVPEPGFGGVFERISYNRALACFFLFVLVLVMTALVRTHWGTRFLRGQVSRGEAEVEPMV